MNSGDFTHIWQASDWPTWRFNLAALVQPLADVSRARGLLMCRLADVGMALRDQACLSVLTAQPTSAAICRRLSPCFLKTLISTYTSSLIIKAPKNP